MHRLPIKVLKPILLTASVIAATGGTSLADQTVYSVGVVPQQSASRLAKMWVPALTAWSEAAGVELAFTTAKDIPTFEACLAAGAYDFAYMNPYHYTVFHDLSGYEAFAHQKEKRLKGLLVVKKDSGRDALSDLDGAKIAFPSPAAFGASVIPRAELSAQGIAFEPTYVKSHDSVYRAVVAGLFDAGGGVIRTFKTIDPEIRDQLTVVYRTEGYTPHAFAANKKVPQDIISRVSTAIIDTQVSSNVLDALGFTGIQPATDSDWDDVRSLNLASSHTEIVDSGTLSCHSD